MESRRPEHWDELVRRLETEALETLAASIGMEEFELVAYLVVDGSGAPAESTVWWPEALRMRAAGTSLREIARRFQTEPRRLRRAFARLGTRVAGEDLAEGAGVPRLAALRDRLGVEPDDVVAKAARVIPEAVKGERRRLGVPAHVQRRRVKLTADDEAWIRGPKKLRRERFRPEPEALHVVRRPLSRPGDEPRRPAPEAALPRRVETPRPPVLPTRTHEGPGRDFFRSDNKAELERLIEPTTRREGPRRLVRAESGRLPTLPPVEPARAPEPERPRSSPVAARPAGALGEPNASVREREPGRPELRSVPRLSESVPAEGVRRIAPTPRPVGSPLPPVRSPQVATAPSLQPAAVSAVAEVAWNVAVPGWEKPLVVMAPDIATAVGRAAESVPPALLARASIWRADAPTPSAGWL